MIVVSARGSEQDKVHALGLGSDDYLAKPFGMGELVARVQAACAAPACVTQPSNRGKIEVPGSGHRLRPAPRACSTATTPA